MTPSDPERSGEPADTLGDRFGCRPKLPKMARRKMFSDCVMLVGKISVPGWLDFEVFRGVRDEFGTPFGQQKYSLVVFWHNAAWG